MHWVLYSVQDASFLYQNTEQNVPLSEKADGASICWDEKPNYPLKLSDCQLQKGQEHNKSVPFFFFDNFLFWQYFLCFIFSFVDEFFQ